MILELWTKRYEIFQFKFEFKPKQNRKGFSISALANGPKHAWQPSSRLRAQPVLTRPLN
jgi:hypothetical protein